MTASNEEEKSGAGESPHHTCMKHADVVNLKNTIEKEIKPELKERVKMKTFLSILSLVLILVVAMFTANTHVSLKTLDKIDDMSGNMTDFAVGMKECETKIENHIRYDERQGKATGEMKR